MSESYFLTVIATNDLDRIFQHGQHAETKQVNLDNAHIGAVIFIPLHNDTSGHGGRLEWYDRIELPLANDHAARVLAEVTWQILNGFAKFKIFAKTRVTEIESGVAKAAIERVVLIAVFPRTDYRRTSV